MNFIKKSLSFLISSTILFNTVYAKQNDLNFDISNYKNNLKKTVRKNNWWKRNSKSVKTGLVISLGLMVILVPAIIIGIKKFYDFKKTKEYIYYKLTKLYINLESINNLELKKYFKALVLLMMYFASMLEFDYETYLSQINLLKLNSETEIIKKIKKINRNTLLSLNCMLQLESECIYSETLINRKRNSSKQELIKLTQYEIIDDDELLTGKIPGKDLDLLDWNDNVRKLISEEIKNLDQNNLQSNGLTIEKVIGNGMQSTVYLCSKNDGEKVAVKIIPENNLSHKNETLIFEHLKGKEIKNIVKYKDHFTNKGFSYFVMEYVNGETLDKHIIKNIKEVLSIAKQIIRTLTQFEEIEIIHRDLKPSNIMITTDGEIKIFDFGLAKPALFATTCCGIDGFLAPEAKFCHDSYNGSKIDIYSAACTIYCLMFNIDEKNMNQVDLEDININSNEKDRFGNEIGEKIKLFFEKCFKRDPDERISPKEALEILNQCE